MEDVSRTKNYYACKTFWKKWRMEHPCVDCSESRYQVIEADHLRDKIRNVSNIPFWAPKKRGVSAMEQEVKKCVARCTYCHALKTYHANQASRTVTQHKTYIARRAYIMKYKRDIGECKHCHHKCVEGNEAGFDFDHLPGHIKVFSIARAAVKNAYWDIIEHELAKTQLLCRNCHKLVTDSAGGGFSYVLNKRKRLK
jgi:hypothetical protein